MSGCPYALPDLPPKEVPQRQRSCRNAGQMLPLTHQPVGTVQEGGHVAAACAYVQTDQRRDHQYGNRLDGLAKVHHRPGQEDRGDKEDCAGSQQAKDRVPC